LFKDKSIQQKILFFIAFITIELEIYVSFVIFLFKMAVNSHIPIQAAGSVIKGCINIYAQIIMKTKKPHKKI